MWNKESTKHLIHLYKSTQWLYDATLALHNDTKAKKKILKIFAKHLKDKFERDYTPEDIGKKISSLRSKYNEERIKMSSANKSEEKSSEKWKWFESLSFLEPHIKNREATLRTHIRKRNHIG